MSTERLAVLLMVAQGALFAAETAAIHQLGLRVPVMELALMRGAGGLLLTLVLARNIGFSVVRTRHAVLQLLRGGVSLGYLWVMIYSFAHLPFADATAISYTQTAYIALFSTLILGETVGGSRWVAAGVGIAGALLIARPGFASWHGAYAAALLGAGLNGLAFVLNRYLQQEDSAATTMFYTNAVLVLGNAPVLATVDLPSPQFLGWLPALVLLGPIGMYAGMVAVRHASASMLAPYTLLRLVISVVGGLVVFRELPDFATALGAILILGSCMPAAQVNALQSLRAGGVPSAAAVFRRTATLDRQLGVTRSASG